MIRACALLLALAFVPSVSAGQTPASAGQDAPSSGTAARSIEDTVEALARTIESQQKLLEEQGRQIEQLRREIAEARRLTPPASAADGASTPDPLQQAAVSEQSPAAGDQANKRGSEVPPDVVTVEEFPGAFTLPGSDAALKIGGLVRVNWVSTFDPLLVDDRFQTSAIPVAGTVQTSKPGRVNVIASPSRFNFDLRTPTGVGYMRAFIEGISRGATTRCGFDTRTDSGTDSSSVRRGPRSRTPRPNRTGSTSKDSTPSCCSGSRRSDGALRRASDSGWRSRWRIRAPI